LIGPIRIATADHRAQVKSFVFSSGLESRSHARHNYKMKKSDVTCPNCHAGYRRIELTSRSGAKGEFRCLLCDHVLETFDGSSDIAIRLTVQPEKTFEMQSKPL
jgi:transposase-like protein